MRRLGDRPIIFLHIPKTAGMTLHVIIERQYSSSHTISFGANAHQSVEEFKALSKERRAKVRMLKGHMGFGLHNYFPAAEDYQQPVYFTLMRDPIERVISHFHHVRHDPNYWLYSHIQDDQLDLGAFLKTKLPVMLNNGQARLISGFWDDVPFGECDAKMLETAKRNIREHFILVGLTERFDESLCMLRDMLGWQNDISYVPRNVAKNRPKQAHLSTDTLDTIAETNQLDIALYEYAEQLFEEKIQQYGADLTIQVEVLRIRNRFKILGSSTDIMMRDYKVTSKFPVVGRLIAWARRNLTSHLRGPYIDPMLERQVRFNRMMLQEMKNLARVQSNLLRHIEKLEENVKTKGGDG